MEDKNTLGIIVNSNRYFGFVIKLADAALAKGKQVRIHLLGSGWEFIKTDACTRLSHRTHLTLCAMSAQQNTAQYVVDIGPRISIVPSQVLSMILQSCYRYVVF